MTERKPPNVPFESWVDRVIREGMENGKFDDLPGAGKPLTNLGTSNDEMWWVRDYVRREGLDGEALLPTPLRLRKEIERLPDTVRDLRTEDEVREVVGDLNRRIMDYVRVPEGPPVPVHPVKADKIIEQWRAEREEALKDVPEPEPAPRRRWWRRR